MCALYLDPLWGEIRLEEPVLDELARSRPVQRLLGIQQAGASYYLFPERHSNTRFEHSLGVLSVLASLGASLEEQVAGLLHDVPHTAFSHTADILFPNDEHNFHESFQHAIIMGSEIPGILERHDVALRAALDPEKYPLLERPLPELCADRIDYTLRDIRAARLITADEARAFLGHLTPSEHCILVDDADAALWFASHFADANERLWTGHGEAGSYWALAGAIRRGYKTGGFTDADLFSTDEIALQKLQSSSDELIAAYLRLLTPGTVFYEVSEGGRYFSTRMKYRRLDPLVYEPGMNKPMPLSTVRQEYAELLSCLPEAGSVQYRLWSDAISPRLEAALALGLQREPGGGG